MVGQTISHYRVLEKLGEGGMGVVYRAEDTKLDWPVALKFLPSHLLGNEDVRKRFEREAKSSAALSHPNVCTVHEIDQADDQTFIAMELIEGESLDKRIAQGPLKLEDSLSIAQQVAKGLEAAHKRGIVHRDIKPENVMVGDDGHVTIMDFGLAQLTEASRLTKTDETVGTVAYMSPEQTEGSGTDHRTDIWSLGVILYEMITGQQPFKGDYDKAVMYSILNEDPEPPTAVRTGVPMELEVLVDKCLAKSADERYRAAGDIVVDLSTHKKKLESGRSKILPRTTTEEHTAPAAQKSPSWVHAPPSRQRIPWVLFGVSTAAALAVAVLHFTEGPAATSPLWTLSALTSHPGLERSPALSPDGEQVAFIWDGEDGSNNDVYVRLVEGGTALRLTTDPASEAWPCWSPDGNSVAFYRDDAVFTVPALGGPERRLAEFPGPGRKEGLSWSPDGRFIAAGAPDGISLIDVGPGTVRALTEPEAGLMDRFPSFSPNGLELAFSRGASIFQNAVYVLPLSADAEPAGAPEATTAPEFQMMGLDWFPDGDRIVFAAPRGSRRSLWVVGGSYREPQPLPIDVHGPVRPSFARHADRLVYERYLQDFNIWRVAGPGPNGPPPAQDNNQPTRLIASTWVDREPAVSPDGRRIVFSSRRTAFPQLWRAESDGSKQMQLTQLSALLGFSPSWSPDGESIVFDLHLEGHSDIYQVRAEGGDARRLTTADSNETGPSYSRDGNWVYFASNRSGEAQIWKVSASGGQPEQVTRNGGVNPIESPDGMTLYYSRAGDIWRQPVAGGEPEQVFSASLRGNEWTLAGRSLYYFLTETRQRLGRIEVLRLDSGETFELTRFARGEGTRASGPLISVAPDESYVVFARQDRIESDLILVDRPRVTRRMGQASLLCAL